MKTKYTKGEWKVSERYKTKVLIEENKFEEMQEVDIWCKHSQRDKAEANAKLIAAAPDLLEIALEIFNTLSKDTHCVNKYASELMDLHKAIKKATE